MQFFLEVLGSLTLLVLLTVAVTLIIAAIVTRNGLH